MIKYPIYLFFNFLLMFQASLTVAWETVSSTQKNKRYLSKNLLCKSLLNLQLHWLMLEKRNLITTTNKTLKVSMKMENQIFPKKKKNGCVCLCRFRFYFYRFWYGEWNDNKIKKYHKLKIIKGKIQLKKLQTMIESFMRMKGIC